MQQTETCSGCVERVVFRNQENGWSVLEVQADDGQEYTVVGIMPTVFPGLMLQAQGSFIEHPTFGTQFKVERYEQSLPSAVPAILRYLASGAVKGIGVALAARIVQKFGADTLRVMEQDPMQLATVRGITEKKARQLGDEFAQQRTMRELITFFAIYAIPSTAAMLAYRRFGALALAKVRSDPYLICLGQGSLSFEEADRIAQDLQFSADDIRRVQAGILYVLQHNLGNGHTCLPADRLLPTAAEMLAVELETVQQAFSVLQQQQKICCSRKGAEIFAHLPEMYRAEKYVAEELVARIRLGQTDEKTVKRRLQQLEKQIGLQYNQNQKQAILKAVTNRVFILTGGPGTGKTTTLRGIIQMLEQMGEKVAVAAPTGRAAQRISELTGRPAKTLHRLLEAQFGAEDAVRFLRNASNPLDVNTLVIDEVSMVEAVMMSHVLSAMKPYTRIILVGDADQLPSIGAGSVLLDCLQSEKIPSVRLTEVFRQALQSDIVANAHRIVDGQLPQYSTRTGDCFFLATHGEEETVQTVVDLCTRRLPASYNINVWDGLQVLCPSRRAAVGAGQLNAVLQQAVNPEAEDKQQIKTDTAVLRIGDKVIQTRNNYDIAWVKDDGECGSGVFNGDIGVLTSIDIRREEVTVRYDDRLAKYTLGDLRDVEPAYAITVHKSQGSEFEAVILPLLHLPSKLCYRNLLYTAVTRAKRLLIVVGSAETVQKMVQNNRRIRRYTALTEFLREEQQTE